MTTLADLLGRSAATGDPAAIHQRARKLTETAEQLASVRSRLAATSTEQWQGPAATRFHELKDGQLARDLNATSGAFERAGSTLRAYAGRLDSVQHRGRDLVARIDGAEQRASDAGRRHADAVRSVRAAKAARATAGDAASVMAAERAVAKAASAERAAEAGRRSAQAEIERLRAQAEPLRQELSGVARRAGDEMRAAAKISIDTFGPRPGTYNPLDAAFKIAGGVVGLYGREARGGTILWKTVFKQLRSDPRKFVAGLRAAAGKARSKVLQIATRGVHRAANALYEGSRRIVSKAVNVAKHLPRRLPWTQLSKTIKAVGAAKAAAKKLPLVGSVIIVAEDAGKIYGEVRSGHYREAGADALGTAAQVGLNLFAPTAVVDLATGGGLSSSVDAAADVGAGRATPQEAIDHAAAGQYGPFPSMVTNFTGSVASELAWAGATISGDQQSANYFGKETSTYNDGFFKAAGELPGYAARPFTGLNPF